MMKQTGLTLITLMLTATLALPASASDVNQGRSLYRQYCAMCHGANGEPEMAGAADFRRGQGLMQGDNALVKRIERGNRACPAFRGLLSRQDMLDVIAYIRTLF